MIVMKEVKKNNRAQQNITEKSDQNAVKKPNDQHSMCIENSVHNFLNMFAVVANVFRFTTFTFYARRPSYHRYYSYQLDVCVCFFSLFGTNKQFECVRVDFFSTFFRPFPSIRYAY